MTLAGGWEAELTANIVDPLIEMALAGAGITALRISSSASTSPSALW